MDDETEKDDELEKETEKSDKFLKDVAAYWHLRFGGPPEVDDSACGPGSFPSISDELMEVVTRVGAVDAANMFRDKVRYAVDDCQSEGAAYLLLAFVVVCDQGTICDIRRSPRSLDLEPPPTFADPYRFVVATGSKLPALTQKPMLLVSYWDQTHGEHFLSVALLAEQPNEQDRQLLEKHHIVPRVVHHSAVARRPILVAKETIDWLTQNFDSLSTFWPG